MAAPRGAMPYTEYQYNLALTRMAIILGWRLPDGRPILPITDRHLAYYCHLAAESGRTKATGRFGIAAAQWHEWKKNRPNPAGRDCAAVLANWHSPEFRAAWAKRADELWAREAERARAAEAFDRAMAAEATFKRGRDRETGLPGKQSVFH